MLCYNGSESTKSFMWVWWVLVLFNVYEPVT